MENDYGVGMVEEEDLELPPGFRFHPTDEELITHYLSPKVLNSSFRARAIGEVDLNRVEPWDLPWKAKMGEKERYFFSARDRKYPTGQRTNRATDAGYWKATGKDREIFKVKTLVGMKKTLVFYKGRAPKGEKTSWVMHEYRLEAKISMFNPPKSTRNEWVICRVFNKRLGNCRKELRLPDLPPLLELSTDRDGSRTTCAGTGITHVPCFSDPKDRSTASPVSLSLPEISAQITPCVKNLDYPDPLMVFLMDNNGGCYYNNQDCKLEQSEDAGISTDISSILSNHEMVLHREGTLDFDYFWNYQV